MLTPIARNETTPNKVNKAITTPAAAATFAARAAAAFRSRVDAGLGRIQTNEVEGVHGYRRRLDDADGQGVRYASSHRSLRLTADPRPSEVVPNMAGGAWIST